MKTPKDHITTTKAALRLGVSRMTVRSWVKAGLLPGVVRTAPASGYEFVFVLRSARVQKAFEVRCLWCGKKFIAKHPKKARYCCSRHKQRFLARQCRASLAKPAIPGNAD